ncbi:IS110 family transposase [Novosphingobium sp. RD2P27]|uniref:IS110 family transposase n=1 Tax=Novosphingobium kalidii TaxID=3230299 RepID=A0ABV2D528_9SPHN
MSVPGVGPITALTFTASVEDPRRFARSEDVGAYAGLVPRRSQSGERHVRGNISKAGDPMLRRSLYEAANIMLCRLIVAPSWRQARRSARKDRAASDLCIRIVRLDGAFPLGDALGDDDAGECTVRNIGEEALRHRDGKLASRDKFASFTSGGMWYRRAVAHPVVPGW